MNLLYFREDADSPWQSIPAIKGEDGKDYVLTDADKEEIAQEASALVDLSDYPDVETVDEAINGLKQEIEDAGYATTAYVDNSVSNITSSGVGAAGTGLNAEIFNDYSYNTASGEYAHAEGQSTDATNKAAHAEGKGSVASGLCSHAEGHYTTASGIAAHAEGFSTTSSGSESHAEGYYTIASSSCQHVQGKHNIEDAEGTYAHIVGNGSVSRRSNAHTLDWDGNAWYAGTVEGTALILSSPNGTRYKITVNDSGTLSAAAL